MIQCQSQSSDTESTTSLRVAPSTATSEASIALAAPHLLGKPIMLQEPLTSDASGMDGSSAALEAAAASMTSSAFTDPGVSQNLPSEEHSTTEDAAPWNASMPRSLEAPVALEVPTSLAAQRPSGALVSTARATLVPTMLDARGIHLQTPASLPFNTCASIILMNLLQVFNTEGASGHSVVNNVFGDQHFAYTPPAPHTLELLKFLDPITMNAISRPQCLEGTRDAILQSLIRDLTMHSPERNVLWLFGVAGSGKSTLATTIAERLRLGGQIGAFLFFDRNSPAQSGPDGVVRTLAHQLALFNPTLREAICDVIERDPQIATRTLIAQFDHLIKAPLDSCAHQMKGPVVVILDAFDECGDAQSRRALLHMLVKQLPLLPHQFRFLITSRPEFDLHNAIHSQERIKTVSLSSAEWTSAADVEQYIGHEMRELYQMRQESDELPLDWPGGSRIQQLSRLAAESFIWAATAIRFLQAADDVDERLGILLHQQAFTLGDLYATALRSASNWSPHEASTAHCRKILGAVVVGRIAVTDDTIVDILGLESAKSCRLVLRRLGCLLQWSEGLPIRTLHASFADYLTNSGSCGDEPWYIDAAQHHLDFTTSCLRTMMRYLRFNICQLETSHRMNRDIEDLAQRIEKFIPRSLAYACRFWAEHLSLARRDDLQILLLIFEFFQTFFLYWLEVHSLLGEGRSALQAMLHIESYSEPHHEMVHLFSQDGIKFIRAFVSVILASAPHVYISALPFAPSSIIRDQYQSTIHNTLCVRTGTTSDWPSCEQVLDCDTVVCTVAFSPDGRRIASGSALGAILIWDSQTGEIVAGPFQGHEHIIHAVAYSPDGVRIASGSNDAAVRIWDTQTGDVILGPLTRHTRSVTSVTFSPDGKRIASGSEDHTVRAWDAQTGDAVGTPMTGHTAIVNTVAFSPGGDVIASGSDDRTIRIWEAHTGNCIATFEGRTWWVRSVAFSPGGDHIVSGSTDRAVRLWNAWTGAVVRTFEGHTDIVTSVAVSSDGLRIVSGSFDCSVRIWDLQTGTLIALFREHAGYVSSVSFSPNGLHLASGSYDGTVRIWDARSSGTFSELLEGHSESVNSIAFSPDGEHILSGSDDHTICVWDTSTGELAVGPLIAHEGSITSVAFSPDGLYIASGSDKCTVCLWHARSGELLAEPLKGHSDYVTSVEFLPDSRHIVSGSDDGTIRVWNVQTGVLVAGPLKGHTNKVSSVACSPDGKHIASGSEDKTICIRDTQTSGLLVGPLIVHTHWVTSISFSPDGLHIVSGSWDRTIRIWDARTGVFVKEFWGHTDIVQSVAFSPDGVSVVSGSDDQTVRLWDVQTGASLAVHRRHTGPVNSVAFSPDGTRIVSGSSDKTIHILPARAAPAPHADRGFQPTSQLVNGWMQNSPTELLFWVPPAYRTGLWWPDSMVISKRSVQLDLTKFVHGEDWTRLSRRIGFDFGAQLYSSFEGLKTEQGVHGVWESDDETTRGQVKARMKSTGAGIEVDGVRALAARRVWANGCPALPCPFPRATRASE
ncbi:hypothetical protein HWV62_32049 [Athelia sp. TMB]|nr:hypothetical protein HWV62_32049 [Athelia sp. TMB]